MNLSAMNDAGQPVDWWFMYKISGKAKPSGGKAIAGLAGAQYVYFDSTEGGDAKLVKDADIVTKNGALPKTLNQLYVSPGQLTEHMGWFFYNDEDPITGHTNGTLGHTKGVLAFDFSSDTAFLAKTFRNSMRGVEPS